MGRIKKVIEKIQEEDKEELKEFTIKVIEDDNGKFHITTYKSKNKTECLKELNKDYKGRNYDFMFI